MNKQTLETAQKARHTTDSDYFVLEQQRSIESMHNAETQAYIDRSMEQDIDSTFGIDIFETICNTVKKCFRCGNTVDPSEIDDVTQCAIMALYAEREHRSKRSKGIVYESLPDILLELPYENRKRYIARIAINEVKRYAVSQKRQKGNSGKFAKTLYYYVHNAPIYCEDPMDHACRVLDIDLYENKINAFTSWLRDSREQTVSAFWSLLKKAMDSDYTLNDQERKQLSRFRLAIREYLK